MVTQMGSSCFKPGIYLKAAPIGAAAVLLLASSASAQPETEYRALVDQYCIGCHNQQVVSSPPDQLTDPLASQLRVLGLALDTLDMAEVASDADHWEKVVRKLRAGLMPPAGMPRPEEAVLDGFRGWLESELDTAARAAPNPGRTASFHRLNRAEYSNAIRDLLAVQINADNYLPADDASYGFDNIGGVLRMSQSLLERYLEASRVISRLAVGSSPPVSVSETFRTQQDEQQHERIDGLPFGTRGGILVDYLFPQNADYDLRIQLTGLRGVQQQHTLEITVDGAPVETIQLGSESTLEVRLPVSAGPREIGVAFHRLPPALVEQVRERFQNPRTAGNSGGPYGSMPFVSSLTIAGPYNSQGPGNTPSRDRIFTCNPGDTSEELECASEILSGLARKAYRRPVSQSDTDVLLDFYRQGRAAGDFEDGIELALRRLLVSPEFLVRVEADPTGISSQTPYRVTDLELASRLSFFLWSSIPDEELLALAERGELGEPAVLQSQVRRMLADPRSDALTRNFAGQWLQLRNLATLVRPGEPYAVEFDETLRQAMITETEMFFDSIVKEDRSVLELLTADYTYLNGRLAGHYGIPNIQGSHFRKVTLPEDSPRRGLLGHGSILTLTSHAIRTSPVLRGKWILNNILGTPPPDPPPNIPALDDRKTSARVATMRERMAAHRTNPVCAACHTMIDPAGFALEGFDAIGRYREFDQWFNKIDTSGVLPDGTSFDGAAELREALVERPERFVGTFTEKLMTYALGRGVEYYDMSAVRKIVRDSAADDYSMQSIIAGIITSYPFLHRRSES
jgi:mono/diheme cytochrome c family protein